MFKVDLALPLRLRSPRLTPRGLPVPPDHCRPQKRKCPVQIERGISHFYFCLWFSLSDCPWSAFKTVGTEGTGAPAKNCRNRVDALQKNDGKGAAKFLSEHLLGSAVTLAPPARFSLSLSLPSTPARPAPP
jgi:hypothetical protein